MARQFSRNGETGAITGYLISVVLMAILLIGGVLLLKGNSASERGDTTTPNETATVTNPGSDEKAEDTTKDESGDKTKDKDETASTNTNSSNTNTGSSSEQQTSLPGDIASTGDTTPETPETIVATGPAEDFLGLLLGLLVAAGAIYMAWNYRLSRVAVKSALLNK